MKKIKIIAAILLIITLIVGISNIVLGKDSRTKLVIKEDQTKQVLSYWGMYATYNNVYCIEHGQKMDGSKTYTIKAKVKLNGEKAEFYTQKDGKYTLQETVNNEANNVLGAILTDGNIDGKTGSDSESTYTYGYKVNNRYSDAQLSLYKYMGTWIEKTGASKYGFEASGNGLTTNEKNIANKMVEQAEEKAEIYSYNVTLYLLQYWDKSYQSLIVTDPQAPDEEDTKVAVTKIWIDGEYANRTRPTEITVKLFANDVDTGKTVTLNEENKWYAEFTELTVKDENNQLIQYTVQEVETSGYGVTITGNRTSGFTITNILKTEVTVKKEWNDENNLDEIRPDALTVTLYSNGSPTDKKATLSEENDWTYTFIDLYKYNIDGSEIDYTVVEENVEGYESNSSMTENSDTGVITYTLTNTHKTSYNGYMEITGKVWVDGAAGKGNDINGIYGSEDTPLAGIKVTLKDANGNKFDASSTTTTAEDGTYTIKVNYDNSQNVYKLYEDSTTVEEKLKTAYVEFEYDGLKYTTVATSNSGANTSKAIENVERRSIVDGNYSTVTSTTNPNNWTDNNITAITKGIISFEEYVKVEENVESTKRAEVIKYCNGDGTYTRTYWDGAWNDLETKTHTCTNCNGTGHVMREFEVDVDTIKYVNLGLFEREQPDVALHSDIRKVEVEINNQRYTYMYGIDTDKYKTDITAKFQNKDQYTYRMPVNPADVASLNENKTTMDVYVTYEVSVGNLSNTLTITVDEIANNYDSDYIIESITYGVMNKNTGRMESEPKELPIPNVESKNGYNQIVLSGLGITVKEDQDELEEKIYIKYKINNGDNNDNLKSLFAEEAPLNNASEILKYSTQYGKDTLYAEHHKLEEGETCERNGNAYGGYDYDSHPGNAGFYINESTKRLEEAIAEDDDDIAPAFVLCKEDTPKTLSGTVWEDKDVTENEERLGNGKEEESEKKVQNVKVELYNLDGTLVKLYNKETEKIEKDAVVYTDANGAYAFEGVVTGEYFIKYTYGNDTTMDGGNTKVNARNYKFTIITDSTIKGILSKDYELFSEEEKMWHITHEDGYSVAVDNMKQRLEIPDLQYDNFDNSLNMTAYSKPFKTQVEFETTGTSQVDKDGNIENVSNNLDKLDFGIIERPRENLVVDKTISYIKITLANGQVLTEGDPRTQDLNYVKAMGIKQVGLEKQLLAEIDSELIQGATVEVQYEVTVTNNNEIDYDYGTYETYKDEFEAQGKFEYDKYIVKNEKANYYYYGKREDNSGNALDKIKTTIEFVDYISNEVKVQSTEWKSINLDTLHAEDNKLISDETYEAAKNYTVMENASDASITLEIGKSFEQSMKVSKVLSNEGNNTYDNNIEIIKIDGKTARTIQESQDGKQIQKSYKPGNYVPSLASGMFEQDDDRVKVMITPPTGITNYVITYVIAGLVGLIVIVVGIIFIKKKVLIK